jgi:lipid A 4'-phosphatase
MMMRVSWALFGLLLLAFGTALTLWPTLDLVTSHFFYDPHFKSDGGSFIWLNAPIPLFFHNLIRLLGWVSGISLVLLLLFTVWKKSPLFTLDAKAYFFLFVSLLAGPALVTNVLLKDQWDRARPRQIEQFGGTAKYTPPLVIAFECKRNCSFVSGDASLAFWLHSFAYVLPKRRKWILGGTAAFGGLIGLFRIGMGAHFLSDVFFAALFMALTSAACYWLIYQRGRAAKNGAT